MLSINVKVQRLPVTFGAAICLAGLRGRINIAESVKAQLVISGYNGMFHYRASLPPEDGHYQFVREYGYRASCVTAAIDEVFASYEDDCTIELDEDGWLSFKVFEPSGQMKRLAIGPIGGMNYRTLPSSPQFANGVAHGLNVAATIPKGWNEL